MSEIVAAAGISNQTLYRSFPSKDDLMLAVLEQGVFRVAEAVAERMARTTDPQQQVVEWVRGVLRQVSHGDAAKTSRSVLGHLGRAGVSNGKGGQAELLAPIADLLLGPLAELGEGRTESVDCISDLVFGAMRRYLWSGVGPERLEVDRVSGFVLGGLGLTASEGGAHA
ncbi:TetR/AcrR family transcriptional regulator [Tomitella biformata]|uniref:TetR/AcrR family transcriptional regulator n=1 Tax=Tomitella biformata TaxID=630403 RepID=UPI0004B5A012|nr:TetR/AcrR family transcriptional regulator [Tomitella biformata]